jgi:hypothetical protein
MRSLALLLALATPTAAIAGDFPVSAVYGTPRGCALFEAGGVDAVTSGGDRFPDIKAVSGDDEVLVVSPKAVSGVELECDAADAKIEGTSVRLVCLADENDPNPPPVTMKEDRVGGTLAYTDNHGTITLRRCAT